MNKNDIANLYERSQFDGYSDRIKSCGETFNRFCRVRFCPDCQKDRTLIKRAKTLKVLEEVVAEHPSQRWVIVTLTYNNLEVLQLQKIISTIHARFKRLADLKNFPAKGWLKSIEVSKSENNSVQLVFHCLLIVSNCYFSGKRYLKKSDWTDLFSRLDPCVAVQIEHIPKGSNPAQHVFELFKTSRVFDEYDRNDRSSKNWLISLTKQLFKMREISTGGILKKYFQSVEIQSEDKSCADLFDLDNSIEMQIYTTSYFTYSGYIGS